MIILIRVYRRIQSTTLHAAWWWGFVAMIVWAFALVASFARFAVSPFTSDVLWYLAAVLTLCPFVSVLGARRPVANVWSLFVVFPLIAVFCLPIFTNWGEDRLHLELPAVLGFCLVAMMGAGNYLGTRHTFSVIAVGVALFLVVNTFTDAAQQSLNPADIEFRRILGACFFAGGFLLGHLFHARRQRIPASETSATDLHSEFPPWTEFLHMFGILWAKRILERVNRTAEEERWPARLDFGGFIWNKADLPEEEKRQTQQRLEQTLRWLFKRFVDSDWIDRHLNNSQS
ncbi:MAG: hypothetical protein Tsb009_16990 [Planctomycetaceae bacterium]